MVTTTEKLTGKTAVITGGMTNSTMLSRRAIQSSADKQRGESYANISS
jgi:hypothetical protein